jgi:hypothetical protein
MKRGIVRSFFIPVFVTALSGFAAAQAGPPFDPFVTYGGMMLSGRIQNIVATDQYLAVHIVVGPKHEEIWVLAEPDFRLMMERVFIHIEDKIILDGDRIAFVASETEPTSSSVGLHIFNVANGARVSYARIGLVDHIGRFLIAGGDAVVNMTDGSVVYGETRERGFEFRAVIGDRILAIVHDRPGGGRKPVLYSPFSNTDAWAGQTLAPEVVEFIDKLLTWPSTLHFDGFPVLLAGQPRTKSSRPFRFLLLKSNGEGTILDRTFFGLQETEPYATVDFAYSVPSASGRTLVAGINTRHMGKVDGEKMLIATFDDSGRKLAQAQIDLHDNSVAWTGIDISHNLLVCLNQYRPKAKDLIATYFLPALGRTDAECAFSPQVNNKPAICGSDLIIWDSIRKYPHGTPVPPGAIMTFPAVIGVNPRTAAVNSFYPFDSERWKLMIYLNDRGRHVFNASHIFLPFEGGVGVDGGYLVLPIPRTVNGWVDAWLEVNRPAYVERDYDFSYGPPWASLAVNLGTLDGTKWHTLSQPGTAYFTVSFGAVRQEFPVTVVGKPANQPPTAKFVLIDRPVNEMWLTEALFEGEASSDPDGHIVSYLWDYGDGTPASGSYGRHTYRSPGEYTVTLTVTDDKGATGQMKKKILAGRLMTFNNEEFGVPAVVALAKTVGYDIEVTTGDVEDAGTNAAVYIALYGPKNADGERTGTGEISLYGAIDETNSDPFERGKTDVFKSHQGHAVGLSDYADLSDIEFITLRHDDSGGKAEWNVKSIRIKNQATGQEWFFEPNTWLGFNKEPLKNVMARFTPSGGSYPRGVLFGGPQVCWDMTQACDNTFILNAASGKFYFTMLDKANTLEIYLNNVIVGRQYAHGEGVVTAPYIPKTEWGVEYDIAAITKPTRFKVRSMKPDYAWSESFVWIFPSNWKGHDGAVKGAVLLYPMKGQTSALSYGDTARQFLRDQDTWDNMLAAALQPIINYGTEAMGIFGMPTATNLSGPIEVRVGFYVSQALDQAIKKLGLTLQASILGETIDLFKSLISASEWARQLGSVTASGAAAAGGLYLLGRMADNDTLLVEIVQMLNIIKGKMDAAIGSIDSNDPAGFERTMAQVKTIALGKNSASQDPADYIINYATYGITDMNSTPTDNYCLSMSCILEYNNIQRWKVDDYPGVYPSDTIYPISEADKKAESKEAMKTFEPLFKNLMMIAGVVIDIALLM